MPRPSSPLDAKASFRSPYALDRSQQNSCPAYDVRSPLGRRANAGHALCICQTMMSSKSVLKPPGGGGQTLASRCHFTTNPGPLEGAPGVVNLYLSDRVSVLLRQGFAGSSFIARNAPHEGWWSQTGSNRRPDACKAPALPTELWPLKGLPRRAGRSRSQGW